MELKNAIKDNAKPLLFTLLVLAVGTAGAYQEGYFSQNQAMNPMMFGDMRIKVVFEGDDPELLAYAPDGRLASIPTLTGDPIPFEDTMVLGYDEARAMAQENNITATQALFGYDVMEPFLGKEIRVNGMLKRTNTLLDMMHILPKGRFDNTEPGEAIGVKYTDDKMPKFFYYIKSDGTNWPKKISFSMGGLEDYERLKNITTVAAFNLGGFDLHLNRNRTYLPLVLGSNEARMMMDEKLFSKTGDKIDGFFGNDVVIAGVLEPTGTVLDMFHYMPAA
jgi:hypothetical protein